MLQLLQSLKEEIILVCHKNLNLTINHKDQPFWKQKHSKFKLLKWVKPKLNFLHWKEIGLTKLLIWALNNMLKLLKDLKINLKKKGKFYFYPQTSKKQITWTPLIYNSMIVTYLDLIIHCIFVVYNLFTTLFFHLDSFINFNKKYLWKYLINNLIKLNKSFEVKSIHHHYQCVKCFLTFIIGLASSCLFNFYEIIESQNPSSLS